MLKNTVYNFSAGPCILPKEVFQQAADEMLDYRNTGISVLEMSHRSPEFAEISRKGKSDLRKFLEIPDNFEIFFFQGGATMQYSAVIKNLLKFDENGKSKNACYITTGLWSNQCIQEAKKMFSDEEPPIEVATGKSSKFRKISDPSTWKIDTNSSYIHYCQNETVHGFQFGDEENNTFPHEAVKGMTVVCDMSSDIGSRRIDWKNFGMVYAGAQKNLGAAGVTVCIIRKDLIGNHQPDTPFLLDWQLFNKSPDQYFNTPATYSVYITGLNIAHMLKQGGLNHYINLAEIRSNILYGIIDNSNGFYINTTQKEYRSKINIPFRVKADSHETTDTYFRLEELFLEQAKAEGLIQLKGHSTNKGIRASCYNAMPVEGVHRLAEFMSNFQQKNQKPISPRSPAKM